LELDDRRPGSLAEDPILPTRVEPQGVQPALQVAHVVAAEGRGPEVERPIPETPAGLDELSPRGRADQAVGRQTALLLEGSDGRLGRGTERPVELGGVDTVAEGDQPMLHVAHRLAHVAGPDHLHVTEFRRGTLRSQACTT
jgi:hypothetical protein